MNTLYNYFLLFIVLKIQITWEYLHRPLIKILHDFAVFTCILNTFSVFPAGQLDLEALEMLTKKIEALQYLQLTTMILMKKKDTFYTGMTRSLWKKKVGYIVN